MTNPVGTRDIDPVDTADIGMAESWVQVLRGRGDRAAVVEADTGRTVSGRALADGVNTATTRWRHRYPDGATIALTGFNGIPWLRTMLGMSAAGCVTATINPLGAPAEILAQLHRCRARHLVADPSVLARVNDDLDTTVSSEELRPDEPAESAAALDLPAQHPDQVQLLMTSSGTSSSRQYERMPWW